MRRIERRLGATILAASFFALLFTNKSYGDEFVIRVAEGRSVADVEASLKERYPRSAVKVKDTHEAGGLLLVEVKDLESTSSSFNTLANDDEIEYMVPNVKFYALGTPNDPSYEKQWALAKVNASAAWDMQIGSTTTVVAITDTGVDMKHPDLEANIWRNPREIPGNGIDDDGNGFIDDVHGWDFRDNDANANDEVSSKNPGHGTHCAGIVGAVGNNGIGVSGISQRVSIMPLRFLGADGSGDLMTAAKTIDYAVANGAHIISASWGAAVPRNGVKPILEAIQRAEAKGILFVAAAANDGRNNDTREVYPANAGFSNVISVAATAPDDSKPSWSNYGIATVDLASPGQGILSTIPAGQYRELSGTSMATPLVAGTAALLHSQAMAVNHSITPQEIKAILQASGRTVNVETGCNCVIDAAAALDRLQHQQLTIVPNAGTYDKLAQIPFKSFGGEGSLTWESSNTTVAKIDSEGVMSALAEGQTTLTARDAKGQTASTHTIFVGRKSGSGENQCPYPPQFCDIMCQINPSMPWCS